MARLIFILGHPGTGKSSSLRNLKKEQVGYISVSGKELPFVADFKPVVARSIKQLTEMVKKSNKSMVVIDDFNFIFNHEAYAAKNNPDQWGLFRSLKNDFYEFVETVISKPTEQNFYCLGHIEPNEENVVIMKTAGGAIRKDVTPEGYTNIVLEAVNDLGEFVFRVRSDGSGVKSPGFGEKQMFETDTVPNDLAEVDKAINNYYKGAK